MVEWLSIDLFESEVSQCLIWIHWFSTCWFSCASRKVLACELMHGMYWHHLIAVWIFSTMVQVSVINVNFTYNLALSYVRNFDDILLAVSSCLFRTTLQIQKGTAMQYRNFSTIWIQHSGIIPCGLVAPWRS